jgi:hypothetical protein
MDTNVLTFDKAGAVILLTPFQKKKKTICPNTTVLKYRFIWSSNKFAFSL